MGTATKKLLTQKCNTAMMFYQYLEDLIVIGGDNGTLVTTALLGLGIACKPDCNFNRLFSVASFYTGNVTSSGNNAVYTATINTNIPILIPFLPPQAAAQCRNQFPSLVSGLASSLNSSNPAATANALASNPGNIAFMRPDQLASLGSGSGGAAAAASIAASLTTGGISLSPIMARSLAQNIPNGTNITGIAAVASGLPLHILANQRPADLLQSLGSMDLNNMPPQRQTFIANQIISGLNNSDSIKSFLQKTNNPQMISAISTAQLRSLGLATPSAIAAIPAVNLPKAFLKSVARSALASATLDTISTSATNATLTYAQMIPGIVQSDILNITAAANKISTIQSVVSASSSEYVNLTSTQRAYMLNQYILATASNYNLTNTTQVMQQVMASSTTAAALWPLFIEANSTVLTAISQYSTFANVISSIASLSASQCCIFSLLGRTRFAAVAAAHSFGYFNLALADLYTLGPCLASVLPDTYFSQIGASVFVSYYSTLGNAFQPTVSQQAMATAYITQYLTNSTLMGSSTRDTFAFTTLGDLAIFYPWTVGTYATMTSNSTWTSSGATLLSTINAARSPSVAANQLCQAGLSSAATAAFTTAIGNYASTFIYQYAFIQSNGTATSRRKRATTTYTCTSLTSLGSPAVGKLSATQLATLINSEFYSCETLLGYAANGWSSSQLTQLVSSVTSYYTGGYNSIPDTDIANLNSICVGFSTTQLASLVFTTTTSISALGALTTWSTAQLASSALGAPLTVYINSASYLNGVITSSFLSAAGNLLCTLNQNQISSISSSAFSVSALSSISVSCPNIAYWYAYAKANVTAYSSLTSSASAISELGSVMAGVSTADIALISADNIGSITTSAWTNMPAATVNSLSATQLAGLSTDQVTALTNNPNAASFSASVTNALTSALTGTTTSNANMQSINMISLLICSLMAIFILNY